MKITIPPTYELYMFEDGTPLPLEQQKRLHDAAVKEAIRRIRKDIERIKEAEDSETD